MLLCALAAVSLGVELEAGDRHELLGGAGPAKALVLYHPSRDADFSDDLSLAFCEGLKDAGFAVERATLTAQTPAQPTGYALVAVVSNTYFGAPDLPTLHYLERARLPEVPVVGLIGGLGSTDRALRLFDQALRRTGARVLQARAYWIWRPNDEAAPHASNRAVALDLARRSALEHGRLLLASPRARLRELNAMPLPIAQAAQW
jgi:hypothetical protein